MRTFEYLKDIFNLHGKSVGWAIIEEKAKCSDGEQSVELKPGLVIKGSRIYVDLFARRLFSTIKLPELERNVYIARKEKAENGMIALVAKDDSEKYLILSKTFINDIYNVTRYGAWMEERLLL